MLAVNEDTARNSIHQLTQAGTQVWVDGVDPSSISFLRQSDVVGITTNPSLMAAHIRSGKCDGLLHSLLQSHSVPVNIFDKVYHHLVDDINTRFDDKLSAMQVSPAVELLPDSAERVSVYEREAQQISEPNGKRFVKIPATATGINAMQRIAAKGIPIMATTAFTLSHVRCIRNALWEGAKEAGIESDYQSAVAVFVSRVGNLAASLGTLPKPMSEEEFSLENALAIVEDNAEFYESKGLSNRMQVLFVSMTPKTDTVPKHWFFEKLSGIEGITCPPALYRTLPRLELKERSSLPALTTRIEVEIESGLPIDAVFEHAVPNAFSGFAKDFESALEYIEKLA